MAKVLYARVSTKEQNLDRQLENVESYDKVFTEKQSGAKREREQLNAMLDYIREGDIVEVHSLDRLGRSMTDLQEIVKTIESKGATFKSKKENIDLSSATGRLQFNMLCSFAQFEREMIRERQAEGIAKAKAKGKTWGNKAITKDTITEDQKTNIQKWINKEISFKEVTELTEMKKTTLYKIRKEMI